MTLYVAPLKKLVRHSWHESPISWRNSCCHSSGPSNYSNAVPFFPHGSQVCTNPNGSWRAAGRRGSPYVVEPRRLPIIRRGS